MLEILLVGDCPAFRCCRHDLSHVGSAARWASSSPSLLRQRWSGPGYVGFQELVDRELESLSLSGINFPLPRAEETGVNVSQELDRQRVRVTSLPCLTPGAKPFLLSRCRVLHGVEFLRSQSIWLENEVYVASLFRNAMLQDLGGNSFQLLAAAATLMALLVSDMNSLLNSLCTDSLQVCDKSKRSISLQ